MRETDEMPNVVIAVARCSRTKQLFGMRFEETFPRHWTGDWAFSIDASSASKEGYDTNEIAGSFSFAESYPGCPACEATSMFQCSCNKIACWKPRPLPCVETCPWCGTPGTLSGSMSSLKAGGDR